MSAKRARPQPKTPLGRIFANTAWLLGGKGFSAICGLAYLAILTRTLGLKGFGHFSLIFGTAQALIAIAGFQTWRVVVRYGSEHIHNREWDKFGRLSMLCGALDVVGAVCGCAIAAAVIYGFGHALDINPAYVNTAFLFNCAAVCAVVSAPTGIVRALHRFDMAVYVEAGVAIGRGLGAVGIWLSGPHGGRFFAASAAVDLIEAALYWAMARRLSPAAVKLSHLRDWRQALAENEGLVHFFGVTYTGATLTALVRYGPLLAVGALVGTKAGGLYRLSGQLTQSMSKLSTLLTRAVYTEVARARVAETTSEFRKLALRTSLFAGIAGAVVVGIALMGGEEFGKGAVILVPLAIAASLELASVAFEPVLHSTGHARKALFARFVSAAALGVALYFLIDKGPSGAAWGVAVGGAVGFVLMGIMAYRPLQRIERGDERLPASTDAEAGL